QQCGIDERDDLEARAIDTKSFRHLEAAFKRTQRPTLPRVEQVVRREESRKRYDPDQSVEATLILEIDRAERQRWNPGHPSVTTQPFEIAEQEEQADAPRDGRKRQVVPLHSQRDEAKRQRNDERDRKSCGHREPR